MSERAWIDVLSGPDAGRSFALGPRALVGRGVECDVRLLRGSISRRHARLERTASGWTIRDLDSTNGLARNGQRVSHARLAEGDEILLGDVRLRFRAGAPQEPPRSQAAGEAVARARAPRAEAAADRGAGGWLRSDLGQRPPGVQLLFVLLVLALAVLLGWGSFAVVRALAGG